MADTEIEAVLRELLGRQDISAETREELQEFRAQAQGGQLDAADRAYVEALARRLGAKSAGAAPAGGGYDADYEEETSWRERAQEAEARAAATEAKLAAVKDAFERTIGKAATLDEGPEAQARRELYDRLKLEIERIEQGEN